MKKLFAVLLALAMVLGMSMTTLAAPKTSATITVKNADNALVGDEVTLSYLQVIRPETDVDLSSTGWVFVNDAIAEDFTSAFGLAADKKQEAIAMLIRAKEATVSELAPAVVRTATAATAEQIQKAFDNVISGETFAAMSNPQTVTSAGLYAVKAQEAGFTYKAMAAYVGFGVVEGHEYPSLEDATLVTKKIPTIVTKTDFDKDNNDTVVIGENVKYTITTQFPYFNKNADNRSFVVFDEISGAEYVDLLNEEDGYEAFVTIGGETKAATFVQNGNKFSVDLSAYIDEDNSNAGETVVVTYYAKVTEVHVHNKAGATHTPGETVYSNEIDLYTGKITFTKTNEDKSIKLANAGFEVKDAAGNVLTFVQKDANAKVYTYDPAGTVTEVFTDANGEVVVEGLDIGTYTFVEKTAPTGYSVNETPVNVVLDITDEGEAVNGQAVKIFEDAGDMQDTKLIALPGTGGIGTTVFTVAGCLIMAAAAYFFFVSRRREEA